MSTHARRLVCTGIGQLEWEHFPVPERLRPQETLIRTCVSVISAGTELAIYTGSHIGYQAEETPDWLRYAVRLGYALVGRVKAVGEAVTGWKPGDILLAHAPHGDWAISDETTLLVQPVPADITPEQAALSCLAGFSMVAVRQALVKLGESVVVMGLGLIGQFAAQLSMLSGGRPTIGIELLASRLTVARELGIIAVDGGASDLDRSLASLLPEKRADVVIEATGTPEIVSLERIVSLKADRPHKRVGGEQMAGPGFSLYGDEERKEVDDVLQTGYLSRYGRDDDPRFKRKVITLEETVAQAIGVRHAIAVNSGTSALMASLRSLGVGPGVEVMVPGYTWVASIAVVALLGATPVLTEIDESFTIDPIDVERKISKRTKVIMPVHILGYPSDMKQLLKIAQDHNLLVLEDSCQAMGGSYDNKPLGGLGHVGAFSLNIFKTLTSGEGGFVTTDNDEFYERAYAFHDQGFMPMRRKIGPRDPLELGMNLKMNELTAAFALGQLTKLQRIIDTLREKKRLFKQVIEAGGIRNMSFERLNDSGECAVVLTVIFPDSKLANHIAEQLGTKTLADTGWHNYNLMDQLLAYTDSTGRKIAQKNSLPQTDDILSRAITLSVGVMNPGLGADFGVSVTSEHEEILKKAELFVSKVKPLADG